MSVWYSSLPTAAAPVRIHSVKHVRLNIRLWSLLTTNCGTMNTLFTGVCHNQLWWLLLWSLATMLCSIIYLHLLLLLVHCRGAIPVMVLPSLSIYKHRPRDHYLLLLHTLKVTHGRLCWGTKCNFLSFRCARRTQHLKTPVCLSQRFHCCNLCSQQTRMRKHQYNTAYQPAPAAAAAEASTVVIVIVIN